MSFESNSFKSREKSEAVPEKKLEKAINGDVKIRKKNAFERFASAMLSDDVANLKAYIWDEVFVPAIKKLVSESIDALLYKDGARPRRSSDSNRSYQRYYDDRNRNSTRDQYRERARVKSTYDYEDVMFETRGEAEEVLEILREQLDKDQYDVVSISDFYELVGITPNFTDNKYGWDDLRSAYPVRLRDGYIIKFPRPMPLN